MRTSARLEGDGRMSSKKRQSYTIEEKQALCLLAQKHPRWTLDAVAAEFNKESGKDIKKTQCMTY